MGRRRKVARKLSAQAWTTSDKMVTIFMGTLLLIWNRLKTLMHRLPAAPDKKMEYVGRWCWESPCSLW